jgi:hypothetical protein
MVLASNKISCSSLAPHFTDNSQVKAQKTKDSAAKTEKYNPFLPPFTS